MGLSVPSPSLNLKQILVLILVEGIAFLRDHSWMGKIRAHFAHYPNNPSPKCPVLVFLSHLKLGLSTEIFHTPVLWRGDDSCSIPNSSFYLAREQWDIYCRETDMVSFGFLQET